MSANSPLVNAHVTRVIDDGGVVGNFAWMMTVHDWMVANGVDKSLLHWADPGFGFKLGSGANIARIYDLGSTWLPRTLDLTPRDQTKTTLNLTGLNSLIPAFVNADGSSQLYWGRGARYAQIRRKQQITVAALYARTQTSTNICLVGAPTSSTNYASLDTFGIPKFGNAGYIPGISLIHTSGTPGTIQFSLSDKSLALTTASVTASGATTQIAIGTYDGTTMKAYSDATGGTGNTGLFRDPYFAGEQALSGPRGSGINVPILSIGDTVTYMAMPNPNTAPFTIFKTPTHTNAYAQFKASSIIVLGVGLDSTKAASLYNLLKTRAGI